MPDDPEAASWTDLRASFDFTPAEEQEIAERADVLLAASEAQALAEFEALLDASSLGDPHVQAVAALTSPEDIAMILRRVRELDTNDQHQEQQ